MATEEGRAHAGSVHRVPTGVRNIPLLFISNQVAPLADLVVVEQADVGNSQSSLDSVASGAPASCCIKNPFD